MKSLGPKIYIYIYVYIYIYIKRKRKKRGLAKLFRAKICLEVEKILYRFQRKRVLYAKCSWDLLVRDGSWV